MNLLASIRQRFLPALKDLVEDPAPLLDLVRPAQDARFGDFQANFAMPLAKQLGRNPRELAQQIVDSVDLGDFCEPLEVAGPGFINVRISTSHLETLLQQVAGDDRLGVVPVSSPRHFVVDFSSPNVAKPMHVGHLRSTVIGDALCRTLQFAGHKVTSDNHIGDWGTQFGMIIYGFRHFRDETSWQEEPVTELARLYRLVNQLSEYHATRSSLPELTRSLDAARTELEAATAEAEVAEDADRKKLKKRVSVASKEVASGEAALQSAEAAIAAVENSAVLSRQAADHPQIARLAREETARLHAGDEENLRFWNEFLPCCLEALQRVYDRLGVQFDLTLGESFYNPRLADVVESLAEQEMAVLSDGAMCVFSPESNAPFIVRKSDGAFTYATTDLATVQYRRDELGADEVLYVVDKRQSGHFQQLFETSVRWGIRDLQFRHVSFGTVMGSNGRPYKTRSGDTVGLESLLDEAVSRARRIVNENDDRRETASLTDEQRARVAEIVGLGGIKYADLHHNRDSDYIFDWDKMLATTGDTATYMQYAYARVCGIFRKLELDRSDIDFSRIPVLLHTAEERRLGLQLLSFGHALDGVLAEYRPHLLTSWLFSTTETFSQFFDKCSVQKAESEELQKSRLVLCDLMARAIRTGLSLLGIDVTETM